MKKDCEKSLQTIQFVVEQRSGYCEQPNSLQELKENDCLCSIDFATSLLLLLRIAQKHTCNVEHNIRIYLVFILAN